MKNIKRILSILIACAMLVMAMPFAVSAAGTKDDPINAADKWFGSGVNIYLLNPTIAEGSTDGIWYTLTAENDGILFLEHSYKNVDYTIYVTVNGMTYEGGCVDGVPYNRPIHTYSLKKGDLITVQIVTEDAAAGTVYASMNVIQNAADNAIKVKSVDYPIYVAAGETVYFQDDSLQAEYATKTAILSGDSVKGVTFYNVINNTNTGVVSMTANTDTDGDGVIELAMGGSEGGVGTPAIKPAWAVENNSSVDKCFTLSLVDNAHECVYDDDLDTDCNTCGAIREADSSCKHVYSLDIDATCDICGAKRNVDLPLAWGGASISEAVNGLSCRFDMTVAGMATNGTEAVYNNATFCGYKLVSMGAIVCNNFAETNKAPTHADVDGQHVTDIPVKYLYSFDAKTGAVSFATRLCNIPNANKDTTITFIPYVIVADDAGAQHTLYISDCIYSNTYNGV